MNKGYGIFLKCYKIFLKQKTLRVWSVFKFIDT